MIHEIPKEELINGAYYLGGCEETYIALWNKTKDKFEYMYNGEIRETEYFNRESVKSNSFIPLLKIDNINTDIIKDKGKLQIKK